MIPKYVQCVHAQSTSSMAACVRRIVVTGHFIVQKAEEVAITVSECWFEQGLVQKPQSTNIVDLQHFTDDVDLLLPLKIGHWLESDVGL